MFSYSMLSLSKTDKQKEKKRKINPRKITIHTQIHKQTHTHMLAHHTNRKLETIIHKQKTNEIKNAKQSNLRQNTIDSIWLNNQC